LRKIRKAMPMALPKVSASVFAALGDDTRLRLLARLSGKGPMSITGLTSGAKVTRQAISKHLRVMERSGLVRSSRYGRERRWRLNEQRLADARFYLDQISRQWDSALERLRTFVEL
jgi:DNA-binding transcriptional ArsR family regulator